MLPLFDNESVKIYAEKEQPMTIVCNKENCRRRIFCQEKSVLQKIAKNAKEEKSTHTLYSRRNFLASKLR